MYWYTRHFNIRIYFQPTGKKSTEAKKTKGNSNSSFKDDEVMKEAEMSVSLERGAYNPSPSPVS